MTLLFVLFTHRLCNRKASFAEAGVSRDLHVGQEVSILGISLFVLGLGKYVLSHSYCFTTLTLSRYRTSTCWPAFGGPWAQSYLSCILPTLLRLFMACRLCSGYWYVCAFCSYILLSADLSRDEAVYLVFRFVTGFCSAAFLSVSGGSVSDVFDDKSVAMYVPNIESSSFTVLSTSIRPMAVYTLHPFIGPALGPFISG